MDITMKELDKKVDEILQLGQILEQLLTRYQGKERDENNSE